VSGKVRGKPGVPVRSMERISNVGDVLMKRLAILLAVMFLGVSVFAQEEERDVLEVGFYGGLAVPAAGISDWNDSLGAKTGWDVGIDVGYFASSNIVIGLSFVYSQFSIDAPADNPASELKHRLYNPNLYFKYYFIGESNWEPYIKAHVGVENAKFTTPLIAPKYRAISYDPALAYGFGAGIFRYTSDYSGLYLEATYHLAATSEAKREYAEQTLVFGENLGVVDLHLGIRILIGSGS